ncbi:hypothetical protein CAOG_010009 [Capsaspora owczarzaki ATCC 30864]|uniref:glutamate--tRNA ligase n=1 Tax=Capsaspora owczarzaki (strain ATCC 30864) TaxID=595528 RepID=A0A0D2VXF2_CAPO3|nr:hypothetical protein CAOG_010009 [Capsaspora owczarzaki ATCC 30864]
MSYTIKGDSAVLQVVAAIVREHGVQVKIEGKGVPAGQLELTTAQGAKVGPATAYNLARLLSRLAPASGLYGAQGDALVATEVDTWVDFAASHLPESGVTEAGLARSLASLDTHLRLRTYLVGSALSLADVAVVLALSEVNKQWAAASRDGKFVEVTRWATHLATLAPFGKRVHYPGKKHEREPSSSGAASASSGAAPASKSLAYQHASDNQVIKNQSAKFVVLPGAEMGKVVTRFPPEASGYLHVGHAKAALLNEYYARIYEGTLIMRFDDTNPAKENSEFEQAILEDLESLGIKPDKFTHTSDWFDTILQYGERMLKEGKAFVDDTPVDKMRSEREARQNSYRRDASVEDNLKLWAEMIKGSPVGLTCCMRAKIDMQSNNGALRDPVMFRCKNEIHVRTGDKYKCYPTYDMACPIVDSLEGVTHALRTTEYHDRDAQFYWIIDALGLRKPMIYDYSRVNLSYTVLSKRKLQKLVDMKLVDGWNDPRFPTVRGVLRRGMTVGALRDFIISIGSSKNSNLMEWDKFWGYNKKHIDPVAPRFTAIERDSAVPIRVLNGPATPEETDVPLHPKDASIGTKKVVRANALIMERVDADAIKEGEIITLMNWGNHIVRKIYREHGKPIASVDVEYLPEDKDFKKTQKFTWIANVPGKSLVPVLSSDFDYLIIKPKIEEEDNIDDILTPKTRFDTQLLAEPAAANLKKGDIIQFNRRGYYIVDAKNDDGSFTMFLIPDGSAEMVASKAAAASGAIASNPALKKEAAAPATPAGTSSDAAVAKLADQITAQGNTVRDLKAAKGDATAAVAELLKLKAEYKALTGKDFAPGARPAAAPAEDKKKAAAPAAAPVAAAAAAPAAAAAASTSAAAGAPVSDAEAALAAKISAQGNVVRDLKTAKADATAALAELLKLKGEFKALTGKEYTAPGARPDSHPCRCCCCCCSRCRQGGGQARQGEGRRCLVRCIICRRGREAHSDWR